MRYLPHTQSEISEMLSRIGVASTDDLFAPIAPEQRAKPLALEPALSEPELMEHLQELAAKNRTVSRRSFLGAGMYDHHIPPAVDQLLLRSEFYTAYTPYQAEVSQGTLQAIFEFQTMVCELFGQEVANASMYCASSATAEAVAMARRVTGRKHVILSAGLHPHQLETVETFLKGLDDGAPAMDVAALSASGATDLRSVESLFKEDTAAIVIGYPNFLGSAEELEAFASIAHARGALLVTATTEPFALSLLEAPGARGADICVGEGQALAVSPQYGGPGVGLFACKQAYIRQMPGRLVGETTDQSGTRGFVLTLSTREQHIRREKATSNICTNHGLIALSMTIRLAMLGRTGFEQTGMRCFSNAEYLREKLAALPGMALPYAAPTFNEFVLRSKTHTAAALLEKAAKVGIEAGFDLGRVNKAWANDLLVAVTEKHSRADLDALAAALSA